MAHPILRSLPSVIKDPLRHVYNWAMRFSAYNRWVRGEYSAYGQNIRREMFLAIARFHHINRPMHGYYMEFGSHGANTVRHAWDSFRHLFNWEFICFDSFEGLPEIEDIDRQDIWEKGKLKTSEEAFVAKCLAHGIPRERLVTVKGFYQHSLSDEARRRLPKKAAVVYVDCDLYHSTVPILEFIRPFLQPGTVVVFDDWNCFLADPEKGERRAWREFTAKYPELRFEDFAANGEQKAFVFVGLTNKEKA